MTSRLQVLGPAATQSVVLILHKHEMPCLKPAKSARADVIYAARFPEKAREPVVSGSCSVDAIAVASSIHSRAILSRIKRRTGSSIRSAASAHSRACCSYSLTSDEDTGVYLRIVGSIASLQACLWFTEVRIFPVLAEGFQFRIS